MFDFDGAYERFVNGRPDFQEAFDIVRRNASGQIWLIGGAVYRPLVHLIYGTNLENCDFDFLVDEPNGEFVLPNDWSITANRYGNPKFVRGNDKIDFIPWGKVSSIVRRGLAPTFENFLTGVPFTVQSIGYDISEGYVSGEAGIEAIKTRTVGINNLEQALIYSEKKEKPIEVILREKADSLGFEAILP